jgi:hypothetical protein
MRNIKYFSLIFFINILHAGLLGVPSVPHTIYLKQGWNLVGYKDNFNKSLKLTNFGCEIESVWAYSNGSWAIHSNNEDVQSFALESGISLIDSVSSGTGFWVYVPKSTTMTVKLLKDEEVTHYNQAYRHYRLTFSSDTTLYHTTTGLEWQDSHLTVSTIEEAKNICQSLEFNCHTDWRLPTDLEFSNILGHTNSIGSIFYANNEQATYDVSYWTINVENNQTVVGRYNKGDDNSSDYFSTSLDNGSNHVVRCVREREYQ